MDCEQTEGKRRQKKTLEAPRNGEDDQACTSELTVEAKAVDMGGRFRRQNLPGLTAACTHKVRDNKTSSHLGPRSPAAEHFEVPEKLGEE